MLAGGRSSPGTPPPRPALACCVRLLSVPHAAPAPAPLFSPKGRGLNSDPRSPMPKQQPSGTPGKKPGGGPSADEDNSLRAIATTVLEVFLAST
jgi:hypothetical protein